MGSFAFMSVQYGCATHKHYPCVWLFVLSLHTKPCLFFITFYHRYALLPPKNPFSVPSVVYAIKIPNYTYEIIYFVYCFERFSLWYSLMGFMVIFSSFIATMASAAARAAWIVVM